MIFSMDCSTKVRLSYMHNFTPCCLLDSLWITHMNKNIINISKGIINTIVTEIKVNGIDINFLTHTINWKSNIRVNCSLKLVLVYND